MQRIYQIKQTVRFRSWIRKGYAMFFSLGRCVTIGFLGKAVTEVALKKQKSGIIQSPYECNGKKTELKQEHEPDVSPDLQALLALILQPQVTTEVYCGTVEFKINLNRSACVSGIRMERINPPVRMPLMFCGISKLRKHVEGN